MISSILIGAVLGALGGGAGSLLGSAFHKGTGAEGPPPKWPATVGLVLALALSRPIATYMNKPTLNDTMAEIERSQPAYSALRQHEPTAYAEVRKIIATALDQGQSESETALAIRRVLGAVGSNKLKTASDTQLLNASSLISDEMMELSRGYAAEG